MLPAASVAIPMKAQSFELISHATCWRDVEFEPYPLPHYLSLVPKLRHFRFHPVEQGDGVRHACMICIHGYSLFCRPPAQTGCFWFIYSHWKRGRHFIFQRKQSRRMAEEKGLLSRERSLESVVLREQDRRYRAIRLRDNPKLGAIRRLVRGEYPPTRYQRPIIGVTVLTVEATPISCLVALDCFQDFLIGNRLQGVWRGDDPAKADRHGNSLCAHTLSSLRSSRMALSISFPVNVQPSRGRLATVLNLNA